MIGVAIAVTDVIRAFNANATMIVTEEEVDLVAIKNINPNNEITVNYREVLTTRKLGGDL